MRFTFSIQGANSIDRILRGQQMLLNHQLKDALIVCYARLLWDLSFHALERTFKISHLRYRNIKPRRNWGLLALQKNRIKMVFRRSNTLFQSPKIISFTPGFHMMGRGETLRIMQILDIH